MDIPTRHAHHEQCAEQKQAQNEAELLRGALSIGFLRFPLRFIYGQVPLPLLAIHARRPFQVFPRRRRALQGVAEKRARTRAQRRPMTKYIFLSTSRSYSITLLPALSTNEPRAKHASRALALQFHPCKADLRTFQPPLKDDHARQFYCAFCIIPSSHPSGAKKYARKAAVG